MLDVEPPILDELARLSPLDENDSGDWDAIAAHAASPPPAGRTVVRTVLVLAVILAVVLPAVAFSSTVRSFLGLGRPAPTYGQAQLQAETQLPQGFVARIWSAPSTQGGECVFVTYDPAKSPAPPKAMSGGGFCSRAGALPIVPGGVFWSLATGLGGSHVLSGVADANLHVSQVSLRWNGGSERIRTHNGYFVASVPVVASPPFRLLPFDLVATNQTGATVATYRIASSSLYFDRKAVTPRLRAYRRAHGCKVSTWRCRSR